MPDTSTPTTLHSFDVWLRAGHRYRKDGYEVFFLDGRFYVHGVGMEAESFTTVGAAIVRLLVALGEVEVPHD